LKGDAETEITAVSTTGVVKELYWTIYPKTDKERRHGVFLCSNTSYEGKSCRNLFDKELYSKNRLCPKCGMTLK
jgi:hypothetical protein